MNVITKSGNLAPYLRATTQVVANSVKATSPVNAAGELSVPKTFDIVKTSSNNALAAQNTIIGGKLSIFMYNIPCVKLHFPYIVVKITFIYCFSCC